MPKRNCKKPNLRYAREFATRVDFQERAEKAEAGLAELTKLYREQSGRPSQELLDSTVKELTERAENAERELAETRLEWARSVDAAAATRKALQERAEKAERMYDNTRGVLNYIASELSRHLGITGTPTELAASVG